MQNPWDTASFAGRVASRIREFRERRGLSAEALARAAGLTDAEMAMVEEGRTDMTLDMIDAIAGVFDVDPAVLLMYPEENALTRMMEQFRDLPKAQFRALLATMTPQRDKRVRDIS
jgi:transcriptional regulator with XRE-family HTH domain